MLQITPIPALSDNYIWLLQQNQQAIIVDPAESQPVLDFLAKHHLNPTAILLTHNHNDHTDGVPGIVAQYPELAVYGPTEVAQFANHIVKDDDEFELLGLSVRVIKSAGHTAEHVSYLVKSEHLFCGDSLFSGGCGRTFTGDYSAQFAALLYFSQLEDFVMVYPAHEYTQSNLKFAAAVMEPNCMLAEYQERADILRAQGRPTLPTNIGVEKQINPFMQVKTLVDFIQLRQQKDDF
ncbi:hydroxyacylglutathione hydrolase [Pasteurellaceae bacterium LFhippo2]|nr:hydroxyacylglutathione hydrolase [Pasteurellaceae bacterium LFhippo2]